MSTKLGWAVGLLVSALILRFTARAFVTTPWVRDVLGTAGMLAGIASIVVLVHGNWAIARAERERRSGRSGER